MKRLFLFIILLVFIISCGPNKEEMNYIKDYIIQCSSDLIHLQLKKGIKTKDFDLQGNKFSLQIDSTGKPVFITDDKPTNTMIFSYKQHKYKILLEKAKIKVLQIE